MSTEDEVTKVGFPKPPADQQDSYFAQCVAKMAELIGETRLVHAEVKGYRDDLARKAQSDDLHWETVQREISNVRANFETLQKELEAFRNGVRTEVAQAARDSDSKIKLLEGRIEELEKTVADLDAKIARAQDGQDPRERVTLVPPPDGAAPKTAVG